VKDLPQGPYMVARAGVEPMTLRTKDVNSTKATPYANARLPTKSQQIADSFS